MAIFRKMVISVAETCRRYTVCIMYFHTLICIGWFRYNTCIGWFWYHKCIGWFWYHTCIGCMWYHTCIGWLWYHTCIHYLVHFRQHHFWHKPKWRVFANLPNAPNLRIQLVLTEVGFVSDRAMLHLATWSSKLFFSFSPLSRSVSCGWNWLFVPFVSHSWQTPGSRWRQLENVKTNGYDVDKFR